MCISPTDGERRKNDARAEAFADAIMSRPRIGSNLIDPEYPDTVHVEDNHNFPPSTACGKHTDLNWAYRITTLPNGFRTLSHPSAVTCNDCISEIGLWAEMSKQTEAR